MKFNTNIATLVALVMAATLSLSATSALLVQPYNYMLDDSSLVDQPDGGSLSPFYNDQSGASEHNADKDIISIISDRLARLRYARMLDSNQDESAPQPSHFSHEMAELMRDEQQAGKQSQDDQNEPSISSSVASMLLNVAQAAAQASAPSEESQHQDSRKDQHTDVQMTSRGSIMELDTSGSSAANSASMPSKSDLKVGPTQWFNPKEIIPVLKISSMATPSKYKKVYFRSEKKLVDGAFHSPSTEQEQKKSFMKPFSSGVQRRSSRGTSAAPPSVLQDGVVDFLRKFRDVYLQTRPVGTASGSSASNFAASFMSAAASSPLASVLAPASSSGSRPNLASALSAASSMVNSAASVAQAAGVGSSSSSGSGSGASTSTAAAGSIATGTNPIKSPLTAQSYVSFWSKTFPTWVRKMLKQLRRRSLYNSSKRQQHQKHQHTTLGQAAQAAASGAVASVVESAVNSASGSSSSASHSSSSHRS